ncbi:MAG: DUF4870 domain-containing protein [Vulcanimicrobiaceae bacterium]
MSGVIGLRNHWEYNTVDCYFHSNVPSVAPCSDCGKPICATCHDSLGACPSCRLAAKINAASATRKGIGGEVPPRAQQQWRTQQQWQQEWQQQWQQAPQQPAAAPRATVDEVSDPVESRALVALGFPLVPLALLSLFDRKHSKKLRKQAYQAVGFNLGMAGLYAMLSFLINIPLVNISAIILLAFMLPVYLVLSVYFGIKVWHGDDVHVPIIGDWLDEKLPA